jgi:hypothetical protein
MHRCSQGTFPRLNVGTFMWLFGCGLLLAGLYFFMLKITEVEVRQKILSGTSGAGLRGRVIQSLVHVGMWGSMATFVMAIGLALYRFGSL